MRLLGGNGQDLEQHESDLRGSRGVLLVGALMLAMAASNFRNTVRPNPHTRSTPPTLSPSTLIPQDAAATFSVSVLGVSTSRGTGKPSCLTEVKSPRGRQNAATFSAALAEEAAHRRRRTMPSKSGEAVALQVATILQKRRVKATVRRVASQALLFPQPDTPKGD